MNILESRVQGTIRDIIILLTVAGVIFKLINVLDISWWWVFLPILIPVALFVLVCTIFGVIVVSKTR